MCSALKRITSLKVRRDLLPFASKHMKERHEFHVLFLTPKVAWHLCECLLILLNVIRLLCFIIFQLNFQLEIQNDMICHQSFSHSIYLKDTDIQDAGDGSRAIDILLIVPDDYFLQLVYLSSTQFILLSEMFSHLLLKRSQLL